MKTLFLLVLLASSFVVSAQTNYYVSSTLVGGTQDGLSPENAFPDLSYLNTITLVPGDSVLLKCGDTFIGVYQISDSGTPSNPIVFSSYGSGPKPICTGSISLSFTMAGTIEQATWLTQIFNLIVNGKQEEQAKYPDSGFLTVESGTSNTGFTDLDLAASPDYDGKNVCVRTSLWTWESQTVANHSGTSVSFSGLTNQPTGTSNFNDYGYFFFGGVDMITQPGEWAYDGSMNYYPSIGINTSIDDLQGTVEFVGLFAYLEVHDIVISNISFQNQYRSGVEITHPASSDVFIENCSFKNIVEYGVHLEGSNHTVTNCDFNYINGISIFGENCDNLLISNNEIKNNGQFRNSGIADEDNLTGICVRASDGTYIHHNVIDSTGYCGIRCDGTNALIERNKVSNYMLLLTDGGALKSFGDFSQNIVYKNNIITQCQFNHDGSPDVNEHFQTSALYFDFHVNHCTFANNVVYNGVQNGLFLNGGSDNNVVRGNVIYGGSELILINDRFTSPDTIHSDTIEYNRFFALADTTLSVRINSQNNYNVGIINNNWLFNPYSDANIAELHGTIGGMPGIQYSFANWQSVLGFDSDSKESFANWSSSENHSQIFVNDTDAPMTFPLSTNKYLDLDSNTICTEITVEPYYAVILIDTGEPCNIGMDELPEDLFSVYPNPTTGLVHVSATNYDNDFVLKIVSMNGEEVLNMPVEHQKNATFEMSHLPPGVYTVLILSENGTSTHRIVKL